MKSCCWILCALALFLTVGLGCSSAGTDVSGDGAAPATEQLTPEQEATERALSGQGTPEQSSKPGEM